MRVIDMGVADEGTFSLFAMHFNRAKRNKGARVHNPEVTNIFKAHLNFVGSLACG